MQVQIMKSKIHRATVTRADLNYEGSIGIDESLMQAADFIPGEAVHVWNINSGSRLETYVLPAPRGSGEICLNGAAARLVQCGDLVIVTTFCWLDEESARGHHCKVVTVGKNNEILTYRSD
jgi:aspartate 1-decarboxylase